MQSHCQHNLYICHCTPSSDDPSPIHPPSSSTTGYSSSSMGSSSTTGILTSSTTMAPVYVTQTSVAVMTSPTLNLQKSGISASLSSLSPEGAHNVDIMAPLTGCNTIPRVIVNTNGTTRVTSSRLGRSNLMITRTHEPRLALGPSVNDKYLNCHSFWPNSASTAMGGLASTRTSRTCLERIVFVLLTLVLIIIFLVAALVFLYVGSSNLDSYSIVFNGDPNGPSRIGGPHQGGSGGGDGGQTISSFAGQGTSGGGFSLNTEEDGIDIVRIKTTEEKILPGSDGRPRTVVRTKKVCVTPECSNLSRKILQSVNPEQDPCDSFYEFACGGWMTRNQPPPRRMVHSVMSQTRDNVDATLRDLIEKIGLDTSDSINLQLRTFYDSCMDVDGIRTKGSVPAVDFLHRKFGKFIVNHGSSPSLDLLGSGGRAVETKRNLLTELVLQLLRVNGTPLLDISLDLAPRNSSRYMGVVRVPQRSGLLPRLVRSRRDMAIFNRWMRKRRKRNSRAKRNSRSRGSTSPQINHKLVPREEIFRSFQNALNAQRVNSLVKTAETMGILDTTSETSKQADIDEILGFLTALEKVMPTEKALKKSLMENAIYNEYNLEELETSFKFINWRMLLGGLFPLEPQSHDVVLVHDPTYIRKLGRIISLFEPRVVWKSLLVLYAKDVLSDLITVHHGQARWQYCTQVSSMLFGEALSRLFLQEVAPSVDRKTLIQEIEHIFEMVRENIIEDIDRTSWLHSHMKELAKEKIRKLDGAFVGSEIYFNQTFLNYRYNGLTMSPDFFSNVIGMFQHFRNNIYHFLHVPVDRETYTWNLISFPFTVNAFHLQQLNSIVIPLGLLQEAHYTRNVPKYLNLGSLGLTLAHEVLHSLDQTGRDFDSSGTFHHWWDPSAARSFDNVSKCFVEQYEHHFKRPLRIDARSILVEVDGEFTLNENVCDVDAVNVVSDALMSMSNAPHDLVYLPNNPYNPQQLFFINAAQSYCSHLGPVSYVLYLELDEHAPNPERVDGFMMNSHMFSQVFQCPIGSRMNPKKKCSVWS